jgi:hypothetical protein
MDQTLFDMPQFKSFTQAPLPENVKTTINTSIMTTSVLPKILAYSQTEFGNVILYESTKVSLLLILPNGMSLNNSIIKMSTSPLPIVGGERNGLVIYKNRPDQLEVLDNFFNGQAWRNELSEPLPVVAPKKEPFLLCKNKIIANGHQFEASLWEYSDKSLAIFSPLDFSNGNDKLMKPFHKLVCPDTNFSATGHSSGWMIFKNNTTMINFAKQHFPIQFETMYTKSSPIKILVPVQERQPEIIETKQIMVGDMTVTMEFAEYSPLSIALFPSPMIQIPGFDLKDNLKHPNGSNRAGYICPKSDKIKINTLEKYFGIENLENLYTMTEEISTRSSGFEKTTSAVTNGLSDLGIKDFSEIPVSTLLRLLSNKLMESSEFYEKNEVIGDILIYGDKDKVNDKAGFYDDMETKIQVICGNKMAVILSNFEE